MVSTMYCICTKWAKKLNNYTSVSCTGTVFIMWDQVLDWIRVIVLEIVSVVHWPLQWANCSIFFYTDWIDCYYYICFGCYCYICFVLVQTWTCSYLPFKWSHQFHITVYRVYVRGNSWRNSVFGNNLQVCERCLVLLKASHHSKRSNSPHSWEFGCIYDPH